MHIPFLHFQSIEGVRKIKDGYNPATWMLEVSSSAEEINLGVDFTNVYKNSELYRYVQCYFKCFIRLKNNSTIWAMYK